MESSITKEYFQKVFAFLHEYQWLYNYRNTHILANKILDNIPKPWREYFQTASNEELNNVALGTVDANAPDSLKQFIEMANSLKPSYNPVISDELHLPCKNKRLSPKKYHEISNLSSIIDRNCRDAGIKYIVDIGSGLGYLPQILFEKYNYNVLGIEGSRKFVAKAIKIQSELYPSSLENVSYVHHFVTSDSAKFIIETIQTVFKNFNEKEDKVCMVALHACGDLTVHMLMLFNQISTAQAAVIMPCCYLKIKGTENVYDNFPLSEEVKCIYKSVSLEPFLHRPFLRLACQQANSVWTTMTEREHVIHAKNCLFRNILQEVVEDGNVKLKRLKRKKEKIERVDYSITEFANSINEYYQLLHASDQPIDNRSLIEIKDNITKRYLNEYHGYECLIEALTALQSLMQDVCENVILSDRCVYMNSLGISCSAVKVMDDRISPRCIALLASK